MHKIKEYGAPIILAGLTLTTVGTATVASYMVGKDALGLPLAILFPISFIAALAGAFNVSAHAKMSEIAH